MTEKYYTVDQIAELLKIHPKTVQRYIREGRLRANKVGKGWRVSGHDLSTFTEGGSGAAAAGIVLGKPVEREAIEREEIKVSAVVDIPVLDTNESMRIANTLTAIVNSKPPEYGASSLQTQYIMQEQKVRVMIWGSLSLTRSILDAVASLLENAER